MSSELKFNLKFCKSRSITNQNAFSFFPKGIEKGCSVSTVGVWKEYHFLWKVYQRVTGFSVKNGIYKGNGLDLGAKPPRKT